MACWEQVKGILGNMVATKDLDCLALWVSDNKGLELSLLVNFLTKRNMRPW